MKISPTETIGYRHDQTAWEVEPELRFQVDNETWSPTGRLIIYGRAVKDSLDQPRGQEYAMQINYPNCEAMLEALDQFKERVIKSRDVAMKVVEVHI